MDNRPDLRFNKIHENIRIHFDFLLKRGFRIVSAMFVGKGADSWLVTMSKGDQFIKIHCLQGKVNIGITSSQLGDKIGFLDLDILLEYLGKGGGISHQTLTIHPEEQQQLESMALLLREHLDEIITLFDGVNSNILNRVLSNANGQLSMDNCP